MKKYLAYSFNNQTGSTSIEFCLIAPMMVLLIVGILEISMVLTVQVLMEGAVRNAARYGITGLGQTEILRQQRIRDIIEETTVGLVDVETMRLTTMSYENFESIGQSEPFTDNAPPNGRYDDGEAFEDSNNNGIWDEEAGTPGLGGPEDIVLYEIEYALPALTGLLDPFIGEAWDLRASIAVRNEPYPVDEAPGES